MNLQILRMQQRLKLLSLLPVSTCITAVTAKTKAVAIPIHTQSNLHQITTDAWQNAITPAQWNAQHREQTLA